MVLWYRVTFFVSRASRSPLIGRSCVTVFACPASESCRYRIFPPASSTSGTPLTCSPSGLLTLACSASRLARLTSSFPIAGTSLSCCSPASCTTEHTTPTRSVVSRPLLTLARSASWLPTLLAEFLACFTSSFATASPASRMALDASSSAALATAARSRASYNATIASRARFRKSTNAASASSIPAFAAAARV
eukprot:750859-Prorocentrum_minimum.AAC.1